MNTLLVFQSYADKEQAIRIAAILENHDIFVSVEENLAPLDSNFIGQQFSNPYVLKIPGSQFTKADQVLMEYTVINMDEVDKNYMLLSFTNEELIGVMKNRQEWGIYNYKLAEKILQQRNVTIPEKEITLAREEQLVKEAAPQSYDAFWIVFGYIMALFAGGYFYTDYGLIFFSFPALFSLIVGYRLFMFRKTLSDGSRTYIYRFPVRIHGLLIFTIGLIFLLIRIFQLMKNN